MRSSRAGAQQRAPRSPSFDHSSRLIQGWPKSTRFHHGCEIANRLRKKSVQERMSAVAPSGGRMSSKTPGRRRSRSQSTVRPSAVARTASWMITIRIRRRWFIDCPRLAAE